MPASKFISHEFPIQLIQHTTHKLFELERNIHTGVNLLGNIKILSFLISSLCLTVFQIHLHDPAENPVMSDQGFSLAPGSYTKVAVRKVEVTVLVAS